MYKILHSELLHAIQNFKTILNLIFNGFPKHLEPINFTLSKKILYLYHDASIHQNFNSLKTRKTNNSRFLTPALMSIRPFLLPSQGWPHSVAKI